VWTQPQAGERCSSLASLKIDKTTITEAVDVPAGKPFTNALPFAPPVVVTSLPEHCAIWIPAARKGEIPIDCKESNEE
jgi:hypothetical protein